MMSVGCEFASRRASASICVASIALLVVVMRRLREVRGRASRLAEEKCLLFQSRLSASAQMRYRGVARPMMKLSVHQRLWHSRPGRPGAARSRRADSFFRNRRAPRASRARSPARYWDACGRPASSRRRADRKADTNSRCRPRRSDSIVSLRRLRVRSRWRPAWNAARRTAELRSAVPGRPRKSASGTTCVPPS